MHDDQPTLFPLSPPPRPGRTDADDEATPEPVGDLHADVRALADRVPLSVRFGTSSWSFPGWSGIVYRRPRTQAELARQGLAEYARYPLFRTVGIDRSYYAPLTPDDLRRYAAQLPAGFRCCAKVPAMYASPIIPGTGRDTPAVPNHDFLSVEGFLRDVVRPWTEDFAGHDGPLILEIPPVPPRERLAPDVFAERLHAFLARLPRGLTYGVELRDRRLLTEAYAQVLRDTGAVHVYNYWSAMPMPALQAQIVPPAAAPVLMIRLLLRPGTAYEQQRAHFRPFNRLLDVDAGMRRDVVTLLRDAVQRAQPAFVLVNNKAEGSAPLTIRALAELLTAGAPPSVSDD